MWNDEFLTWDPAEHDGVTSLYIHKSKIWLPDTTLYKKYVTGTVTNVLAISISEQNISGERGY